MSDMIDVACGYGAIADDPTKGDVNRTAFNNAIADAVAQKRALYVPRGTWLINEPDASTTPQLSAGGRVRVVGDGPDQSVIVFSRGSNQYTGFWIAAGATASFEQLRLVSPAVLPAPTLTVVGTPGSTTYSYLVVARDSSGIALGTGQVGTATTGPATLSAPDYIRVSFSQIIEGAASYDIHRTAGGGSTGKIASVTAASSMQFEDKGGNPGDGSTAPAAHASFSPIFMDKGNSTLRRHGCKIQGGTLKADGGAGRPGYLVECSYCDWLPGCGECFLLVDKEGGGVARFHACTFQSSDHNLYLSYGVRLEVSECDFISTTVPPVTPSGHAVHCNGSTAPVPTVSPQGAAGSTLYTYQVVAKSSSGTILCVGAGGSTSTGNATLSASNFNRVSWTAVSGASTYEIYRTASQGTPSSTGKLGSTTSTSFDDTGLSGDGVTAPGIEALGSHVIGSRFRAAVGTAILTSGAPWEAIGCTIEAEQGISARGQVLVDSCGFFGTGSQLIDYNSGGEFRVSNSVFASTSAMFAYKYLSTTRWQFAGCHFRSTMNNANGTLSGVYQTSAGVVEFERCVFDAAVVASQSDSGQTKLNNGTFRFRGCTFAGNMPSVYVLNGSNNVTLVMEGCENAGTATWQVYLDITSTGTCTVLGGNHDFNGGSFCDNESGTGKVKGGMRPRHGQGADKASASQLDLGPDRDTVYVTGSTTINQIRVGGGAKVERIITGPFYITPKDGSTFTFGSYGGSNNIRAVGVVPQQHVPLTVMFDPATGDAYLTGRPVSGKGASVASSSTLTLGRDGTFFPITGTTTVDRMDTSGWPTGTTVTLSFGSALAVSHGASTTGSAVGFKLAGSANLSATAGSTVTVSFDGSNWIEVSRMVA